MRKFFEALGVACAALLLTASAAEAASITYTATDLPDDSTGDRWQYSYDATGLGSLVPSDGFSIRFGPTLYSNLVLVSAPSGWDILPGPGNLPDLPQPSVSPAFDGLFDALLLVSGSSTSPFLVDFTWLGAGTPGSQPFETYNLQTLPGVITGVTTPADAAAVPEPSTLLLTAGGALAALRRRRQRRASVI